MESNDSIINIGITLTSISLLIAGIGMINLAISAGTACTLSSGNKILHRLIMRKYKKLKKNYEKDQNTTIIFDKLYRKSLQDNVIEKNEYKSLCNILTKCFDETKTNVFHKHEHKYQINFFATINSNFNLEFKK